VVGGTLIRDLRREDAPAVARLELALVPDQVLTPELVWQRASRQVEREQLRVWVAELDGEVVAYAHASFEWAAPTPGRGRFWVGVAREQRGRGIGSALYDEAMEHLRSHGAWRALSWVDGDPNGTRFLERRGFAQSKVDRVSALDLADAELPEPRVPEGYRLASLNEAREQDLYEICIAGEIDTPGEEPETELAFEEWLQGNYGSPALTSEGSFVALSGERAVSLAFLTIDPERRIAYNQMTATLPEFRRRGLALAVKLTAARWATEMGYERIVTENESTNAGMLAINEQLGYRPLYDQVSYVCQWERPPGKGG